ncbi:hypothetical protein BDV25DRAFT_138595 [Aspergillus avenaceus]|uniref:N-acetyltransferase domain-containing protein n=1 Tax=Aspergillus avenaceus TaxID=36643 RepID=A0A5N6TZA2_ASPAV|nr:hypothetical protein BDV25DRAFT_138595 [Aspergillus avenaceus]
MKANTGSLNLAPGVAEVISHSFTTSPVTAYFLRTPTSTWSPDDIPYALIHEHLKDEIPAKVRLGAKVAEAGDYAAAALWFPPECSVHDEPGTTSDVIREYVGKVEDARGRWLRGRPFWYLNLIGRRPGRDEKGVVRALIDPFLELARKDGVPAWLEAASEHSRGVYAHFGFRVVEEFRVGVGVCDRRGDLVDGGEGVPLWGMIYE